MTDYTFHPTYVEPYYGLLMNANFLREPEKIPELLKGLKQIEKELDNVQLTRMLRSSWRPAKVSAWIIGLYRKTALEGELINTLHNTPLHCEHLIFAITLLNTDKSIGALENHAYVQIDSMKGRPDILNIESIDIDWAIAAIYWLGKLNGTTRAENILSNWNTFKKDLNEKHQAIIDHLVRVDEKIKLMEDVMTLIKLYRQ